MRIKTQQSKNYNDSYSIRSSKPLHSSFAQKKNNKNKTKQNKTTPLQKKTKNACPAEVGALTPVFEKSDTEFKLKQKLLKCKRTIQIATFNVRILNRIGQLPMVTASAIDIDIIYIQEHRYIHCKYIEYHHIGNGWTFVSASASKNSLNATIEGVGMLIKSLSSIEKIQPKMMVATFKGNPSATIISCYSPTNVSEKTDLITSYNELSSLARCIPKHNILVISGDMNAQIGKNVNHKFSLHNSSNRNGEHLTDFTLENASIQNIRKERENYGLTPTQIILKHR